MIHCVALSMIKCYVIQAQFYNDIAMLTSLTIEFNYFDDIVEGRSLDDMVTIVEIHQRYHCQIRLNCACVASIDFSL